VALPLLGVLIELNIGWGGWRCVRPLQRCRCGGDARPVLCGSCCWLDQRGAALRLGLTLVLFNHTTIHHRPPGRSTRLTATLPSSTPTTGSTRSCTLALLSAAWWTSSATSRPCRQAPSRCVCAARVRLAKVAVVARCPLRRPSAACLPLTPTHQQPPTWPGLPGPRVRRGDAAHGAAHQAQRARCPRPPPAHVGDGRVRGRVRRCACVCVCVCACVCVCVCVRAGSAAGMEPGASGLHHTCQTWAMPGTHVE
jgi:hypothetical protein